LFTAANLANVSRQIVLVFALVMVGCDEASTLRKSSESSEDMRLAAIEQKIKNGEAQLEEIRRKLNEEQQKLEEARSEAEFQQCRAKGAELRAEVERRRSECAREIATHNLCRANQSKDEAEAGLGGCLLGIAAAAVSGGAATPWALGGCGAGLAFGGALAKACPVPACAGALEAIEKTVLSERGLVSPPRCGGWLGIGLDLSVEETHGVPVKRVTPGTYAAAVGLVRGDVIVALRNRRVTNLEDIKLILETVQLGTDLKITVIRDQNWLELIGRAAARDAHGKILERAVLGVQMDDVTGVRFRRGVVVSSMAQDSPAGQVLTLGEVLVAVDVPAGTNRPARHVKINNPSDLEAVLTEVRADETISLDTINAGRRRSVTLRLEKRKGRTEL